MDILWTILNCFAPFEPFWTISDHITAIMTILGHIGTILDHVFLSSRFTRKDASFLLEFYFSLGVTHIPTVPGGISVKSGWVTTFFSPSSLSMGSLQ